MTLLAVSVKNPRRPERDASILRLELQNGKRPSKIEDVLLGGIEVQYRQVDLLEAKSVKSPEYLIAIIRKESKGE